MKPKPWAERSPAEKFTSAAFLAGYLKGSVAAGVREIDSDSLSVAADALREYADHLRDGAIPPVALAVGSLLPGRTDSDMIEAVIRWMDSAPDAHRRVLTASVLGYRRQGVVKGGAS